MFVSSAVCRTHQFCQGHEEDFQIQLDLQESIDISQQADVSSFQQTKQTEDKKYILFRSLLKDLSLKTVIFLDIKEGRNSSFPSLHIGINLTTSCSFSFLPFHVGITSSAGRDVLLTFRCLKFCRVGLYVGSFGDNVNDVRTKERFIRAFAIVFPLSISTKSLQFFNYTFRSIKNLNVHCFIKFGKVALTNLHGVDKSYLACGCMLFLTKIISVDFSIEYHGSVSKEEALQAEKAHHYSSVESTLKADPDYNKRSADYNAGLLAGARAQAENAFRDSGYKLVQQAEADLESSIALRVSIGLRLF